jgi:hypothetical protein
MADPIHIYYFCIEVPFKKMLFGLKVMALGFQREKLTNQ